MVVLPIAYQAVPHAWLHDALGGAFAADAERAQARGGHISAETVNPALYQNAKGESNCPKNPPPMIEDSFPQPELLQSSNGELNVELNAAMQPTALNGKTYVTSSYNGQFPGPSLYACPGDTINVNVQNNLVPADYAGEHPGETNIHTHGFHVSPHVPSDNVFRTILPGDNFQYQYDIPLDHPPGAYWYHPHLHGQTNNQVFGGMAGAIYIAGGLDDEPAYRDIPTRDMVIQQTALGNGVTLPPPGGSAAQFFVNGYLNPEIPIQPGEIQRWRLYNASSGAFVKLQLQGGSFQVLARDGNYVQKRVRQQVMTIPPASRREVLVRGGQTGTYELLNLPFSPTPTFTQPQQPIATLVSSGDPVSEKMPPRRLFELPDLRDEKVDQRHKLVYSQEPPNFYINGKQFDPNVVNETMTLNEVNEWTIENSTTFWHTFHIHINDFQVTKINGKPVKGINLDDNVSIPPNGSVTMRTLPTDFTGKFVFHCHVLGHEDNGMMGVVRVVPD